MLAKNDLIPFLARVTCASKRHELVSDVLPVLEAQDRGARVTRIRLVAKGPAQPDSEEAAAKTDSLDGHNRHKRWSQLGEFGWEVQGTDRQHDRTIVGSQTSFVPGPDFMSSTNIPRVHQQRHVMQLPSCLATLRHSGSLDSLREK